MKKTNDMKNMFVVLCCLFTLFTKQVTGQIITTITTGTAGTPEYNSGPIYRSAATSDYDASRYSYLYTAAELATAGIHTGDYINSLGWTKSNNAVTNGSGGIFRIYMKNSSTTTYGNASATWTSLNTGATLVYENLNQTIPATQSPDYITFTFPTQFMYTGGSLEIATEWDINQVSGGASTGSFSWLWSIVPNAIYGIGDSYLSGTGTLSATSNSISSIDDKRPFLQINYSPGGPCVSPPTAGTTVASAAAVCPGVAVSLTLTANTYGSGQTYQWQSSPDGLTYTDIAGATTSAYTTTQSQTTYYRCKLTCNAMTAESAPIQVTSNPFLDCYCTSSATNANNLDIFNVKLGSLNNASSCTTTGGTGSTQGQYSNYAAVAAPDLARGVTYPVTISIGSCNSTTQNNFTKVYIDFNKNGLFTDAGEEVYVTPTVAVGPNNITGNVSIPLTAPLGVTKMRIVLQQTGAATNITPCGTYTQGETEDYLVNIMPIPACAQPTNLHLLTATTTTADLDWTAGNNETSWSLEYGISGFTPGSGQTVTVNGNSSTTLQGLTPNSFYQVYIKSICGSDESFVTFPITFNTYGHGQYMESDTDCGNGFIDISQTGTFYNIGDDDETGFTIPFNFYYQGSTVTNVTIGNNGAVFFGTLTAQVPFSNVAIDAAAVDGIYPYWDDIDVLGQGVYTKVTGAAPNRQVTFQWNKKHNNVTSGPDLIFQAVLDEASGEIYYHYSNTVLGNTTYENGVAATIGIAGPQQDIQLSLNNAAYLTANQCARFYYTDCPKPKNLVVSNISTTGFKLAWTQGIGAEPEWIVEYGPAGFVPGTGTAINDITIPSQIIGGLNPLTTYDVYVYAACSAADSSLALTATVQTLPLCAAPTGLTATAHADSIYAVWNWAQTSSPISGFKLQYGMNGFPLYAGTITAANGINFSDTIHNPALMSGVTYQVYVQAVCGTDTSNYVGPFSVTMPLTNDLVCGAETLPTNGTAYTFSGTGATVTTGETAIAPPATGAQTTTGWANSTMSYTTWFKFTAPNSGQVRISGTDAGFNGQIAVYAVGNCSNFGTFTMIAANDDEIGGTSLAPNFTICNLTPGNTYYLVHDPFSTSATGTYSIKISAINLQAGNTAALLKICTGSEADLFDGITNFDQGGVWTSLIPSIQLEDGHIFASAGMAYQTFDFRYSLNDGCASDFSTAKVKVFPPSNAGTDGSLTVCRNEPFNLLEGLGGTVDMNGIWYNSTGAVVPDGNTTGNNTAGQYNYKYIADNNVCPKDTAVVIVTVQGCDYLGLDEAAATEGFSLYPNPTSGMVYIQSGASEAFSYEVLDVNGRKVNGHNGTIKATAVTEIDLGKVQAGIYMIHVFNGNAGKTFRVIVK